MVKQIATVMVAIVATGVLLQAAQRGYLGLQMARFANFAADGYNSDAA